MKAETIPAIDGAMKHVGHGMDRVDGRLKVCGQATYAAEWSLPRMSHAVMVLSTIPSGRVKIDARPALKTQGVISVLSHVNALRLPKHGEAAVQPPAGRVLALLQDDVVHYNQQPIAVVIADTLEQARDGARLLRIAYVRDAAQLDFIEASKSSHAPKDIQGEKPDSKRGDVGQALKDAEAPLRIETRYTTPLEHHNPMEPHATIAAWQGDTLTIYDSTQYVTGVKNTVAKTLGLEADKVRTICPYVGGGFGSKGSSWSHVVLAAMAARHVGHPVKLALDRPQMFGPVGGRPNTEQKLMLAARADAKLLAMSHDVTAYTSQIEDWTESSAIVSRMLYACPNQTTSHRLARMNLGTPTFMRAPGEATGTFALECAMDELAWAAGMDPIDVRLRNYAEQDPEKDLPFSSKSLRECYRVGAERFGWARRKAQVASMQEGNWQIGLGMATATYPTRRSAAKAKVILYADGSAVVQSGSQDLGTGTYTVMTQVAADALGYPIASVRFELGDTRLPQAPVSGGSQSVASVSPAVQAAAMAAKEKLLDLALQDQASSIWRDTKKEDLFIEQGWLCSRSDVTRREAVTAVLARNGSLPIEAEGEAAPGDEKKKYSMHAFGAVFAEVHVDRDLGLIRVPRVVGAYGIGTLLNAKTGHSQLMGGIVWGISMALFEESKLDPRYGRIVNNNLAEYHVPVNADIQDIEVIVVPEQDAVVNPLGAKGIGEIGITGVAAAIANAVYHATGKRVRDLPITLDRLLV